MSLYTLFGMSSVAAVRQASKVVRALAISIGLGVATVAATPAAAVSLEAEASVPLSVGELRMAGDAVRTRMVVELNRDANFRWFLLRAPHRLVIDLPSAEFSLDGEALAPHGLVSRVQFGQLDETTSRLIFSSDGPFKIGSVQVLENENGAGFRLVTEIEAGSQDEFEAALAEQIAPTGSTTDGRGDRVGQAVAEIKEKPFTIVIDPGHGGIDGGAEGVAGTQEKDITLMFARELRDALAAHEGYRVEMTRESDVFLRLDERVRIARQQAADLFISVHADSIRLKGIQGATVYTVADKASDEEAAATALRENLSDEIAGIQVEADKGDVADILVDLIRRETHRFSINFARTLVGELSETVTLINNPHRFAGFRVLKAPDVPSVLLELGYLSNSEDEARLLDEAWRADAISSITSAVDQFAASRGTSGG